MPVFHLGGVRLADGGTMTVERGPLVQLASFFVGHLIVSGFAAGVIAIRSLLGLE